MRLFLGGLMATRWQLAAVQGIHSVGHICDPRVQDLETSELFG